MKKGFFGVLIVAIAYSLLSFLKKSPSMPSILQIASAGFKIISSVKFYSNMLYTIKIVVIGISISFIVGTFIAFICSLNKIAYSLVMPIINAIKNIPSISLFPLFIILMGIGDAPRIFVIIWNSIYPIISSTLASFHGIDKSIIEAARNNGADEKQVHIYIKMPLSIIGILEGLKISVGNGFIAIVVAEMLGATKGLGYMILWSANTFKYAEMYVYILVVALIGFLINVMIEKFIDKIERMVFYNENKKSIFSKHLINRNADDGGMWEDDTELHSYAHAESEPEPDYCYPDNSDTDKLLHEVCRP